MLMLQVDHEAVPACSQSKTGSEELLRPDPFFATSPATLPLTVQFWDKLPSPIIPATLTVGGHQSAACETWVYSVIAREN